MSVLTLEEIRAALSDPWCDDRDATEDLRFVLSAYDALRDKQAMTDDALKWIQEFALKMLDAPGYVYVERRARTALSETGERA